MSPALLSTYNWDGLFEIYGALGLLWLSFWIPFAKDYPTGFGPSSSSTSSSLASTSKDVIAPIKSDVPWGQIMKSKEIIAISMAHCVQNFGLYITLAWLPTYYKTHFGLSTKDSSLNSVAPWVLGALFSFLAGTIADNLIEAGWERTFVRKLFQTIALIIPALAMSFLAFYPALDVFQTETCFAVACSGASFNVAGFGASVQDVCKSSKLISIVYSVTSAPAVVCGSLGVYGTGMLLDIYHDWSLVFTIIAGVYVFGAFFYNSFYTARKIID